MVGVAESVLAGMLAGTVGGALSAGTTSRTILGVLGACLPAVVLGCRGVLAELPDPPRLPPRFPPPGPDMTEPAARSGLLQLVSYGQPMSRSAGLSRQCGMADIVITGGTGVIGRRVVRELVGAGHRVTGVTRSAAGGARLVGLGGRAVEADVFDEISLRRAFTRADAVINLLTHIPSADRMAHASAWAQNDRLRTQSSAAIAQAAQVADVPRLVQESIAFVYADGGDAWLDEDAPVVGGGVTTSALTGERNARELFAGDTVVLRFGLFIGPDSGSALAAVEAARGGASVAPGPPGAYRPTIWLDDAAAAVAAAVVIPAATYNVADTHPSTNAEIDAALAATVGVKNLRSPVDRIGPLARSQRVSSRRLREASGWAPRMRAGIQGWQAIAT